MWWEEMCDGLFLGHIIWPFQVSNWTSAVSWDTDVLDLLEPLDLLWTAVTLQWLLHLAQKFTGNFYKHWWFSCWNREGESHMWCLTTQKRAKALPAASACAFITEEIPGKDVWISTTVQEHSEPAFTWQDRQQRKSRIYGQSSLCGHSSV